MRKLKFFQTMLELEGIGAAVDCSGFYSHLSPNGSRISTHLSTSTWQNRVERKAPHIWPLKNLAFFQRLERKGDERKKNQYDKEFKERECDGGGRRRQGGQRQINRIRGYGFRQPHSCLL